MSMSKEQDRAMRKKDCNRVGRGGNIQSFVEIEMAIVK